jgi:hypothetical protein
LLNKLVLLVSLQGHYLDHCSDVEVSSGDDDASKTDDLAVGPIAPAGDEAEGEGISLAEPITLGSIRSNTSVQADPSIADRAISSTPSTSRQKRKRPPPPPSPNVNNESLRHIR